MSDAAITFFSSSRVGNLSLATLVILGDSTPSKSLFVADPLMRSHFFTQTTTRVTRALESFCFVIASVI
jgi:hypothetical protein